MVNQFSTSSIITSSDSPQAIFCQCIYMFDFVNDDIYAVSFSSNWQIYNFNDTFCPDALENHHLPPRYRASSVVQTFKI